LEEQEEIAPRTGVEVLAPEERQGKLYFTMRDLRNGNVVKNVTRASARKLWHYAIDQFAELTNNHDKSKITWFGVYGLMRKHKIGNIYRYDLIYHRPEGNRYFFGVTEDGIHGRWRQVAGLDEG